MRQIACSKAPLLGPCHILTISMGLDAEPAFGQDPVTLGFTLSAKMASVRKVSPGLGRGEPRGPGRGATYTVELLCSENELSFESLLMFF